MRLTADELRRGLDSFMEEQGWPEEKRRRHRARAEFFLLSRSIDGLLMECEALMAATTGKDAETVCAVAKVLIAASCVVTRRDFMAAMLDRES
jgi:hypothetical protein